jgi:hypothetical protein
MWVVKETAVIYYLDLNKKILKFLAKNQKNDVQMLAV